MAAKSEFDPTAGPDPRHPILIRRPWQVMAYLKQARTFRNLTTRAVAQMAATTQPTYVGWENSGSMRGHVNKHTHMPQIKNLLTLLDALGYDLIIRPRGGEGVDIYAQAGAGTTDREQ